MITLDSAVAQTSLEAYRPMLSAREQVRSEIALRGPLTDREISENIGMDINCVTARRNELIGSGDVEQTGIKVCSVTGRNCFAWSIVVGEKKEILAKKIRRTPKLTAHDVSVIIQCLEKSIDARAPGLIEQLRYQEVL